MGIGAGTVEQEQSELPVEIHHTNRSSVRAELHDRAAMVRDLVSRLRHQRSTQAAV